MFPGYAGANLSEAPFRPWPHPQTLD
jgi:hypothetical protein